VSFSFSLLSFFFRCLSFHIMPPRQSIRATKQPDDTALQLRWDEFVADFDRGGARNADAVAKFLKDDVNRNWPSLKLVSLQVAYTHLGMKKPLPQGKVGFVAALTTYLQSTASNGQRPTVVVIGDGDDAVHGASRSSNSSSPRTETEQRPSARTATTAVPSTTSSTASPTITTNTSALPDSLAGTSVEVKQFFAGLMTECLQRLSTTKDRPSKRRKVSDSDTDSDSDSDSDTEHKSSSKDTMNKYVKSCLETLSFHNVTLSQHIDNYAQKVGWNNKRNRHEAAEIARLYDACSTESVEQLSHRLLARYCALEEFDSTGNPDVFEHIQASGISVLGNTVKHALHRNVKRSTLGTSLTESTLTASRRPHKQQHYNNNTKNYNNNNKQQQQQQQHNNNGGGGSHGRRGNYQHNNNNNKPPLNGQGAANQAVAGQQ
jgi:hypothetical protein